MREIESSLQQFAEYLLKARLVREKAMPYFVSWVRQFLSRPATDEPLADQVRRFCEGLERGGRCQEWQVRQAEQALRIYFVGFLNRAEWHRRPASGLLDDQGRVDPAAALQQLRARVRTRHYSYRTEASLRGLGAPFSRLCRAAAGRGASSRGIGVGARLPDPHCGTAGRLRQHAEPGVLRDAVP
jgi:hypothetical protein